MRNGTEGNEPLLNLAFLINHQNKFFDLVCPHCSVRNQDGISRGTTWQSQAYEHAGSQYGVGIGENGSPPNCARLFIKPIIDKVHVSFIGKGLSIVGESYVDRIEYFSTAWAYAIHRELCVFQVSILIGIEVTVDRID